MGGSDPEEGGDRGKDLFVSRFCVLQVAVLPGLPTISVNLLLKQMTVAMYTYAFIVHT